MGGPGTARSAGPGTARSAAAGTGPAVPARADGTGYEGVSDAARGGTGDGAERSVISSDAVERRLRDRGLEPRWRGRPPAAFSGLALDSRTAGPGDLFCAIAGGRHDGHAHVGAAAKAGAAAAVVEREVEEAGFPLLQVADSRSAAAHLASLFRGDPAAGTRLVGVTGTNGKTTTVWLLRHLLGELGPSAALGTLGLVRPDGGVAPGRLTTPDPLELMDALAALREAGAESIAMEVSSHALDQRRADALRFDGVAFTNLSREHLDYHGDLARYREAKLRLLELLVPGGACAVNADDPAWLPVGERLAAARGRDGSGESSAVAAPGLRLLRFGFSEGVEVRAVGVRYTAGRSAWRLESRRGTAEVELPLPGEFNVQNALGAAALALEMGLSAREVAARLASVPPVPGRMEVLRREPSLVLRDYAHTPDSFRRVLGALRGQTRGRLIVVFGCGGDRDPGKRPEMGRIASELADLTLVTTDNPRSEDPAEIARQVTEGMPPGRCEVVLDREEAISRALQEAGPGDVVALLGKGHETYQIVGERKLPFDEKAIVARLAEQRGWGR